MSGPTDVDARVEALTDRDRSLLVEAGAGSGKTALMAGRVALQLSEGASPGHIAAITFTELAAAELRGRIRTFAQALLGGEVPVELRPAVPDGLDDAARARLRHGLGRLDDLTATTIHGFALDLIRPYPAESDFDPGATVIDSGDGQFTFDDVFDRWLRERLHDTDAPDDVVVELLLDGGAADVRRLRKLAALVRDHPHATAPAGPDLHAAWRKLEGSVRALDRAVTGVGFAPAKVTERVEGLKRALTEWNPPGGSSVRLALGFARWRPLSFCTTGGTLRSYHGLKTAWRQAAEARGRSKAEGTEAHDEVEAAYTEMAAAFDELNAACAAHLVPAATDALRGMVDRFRDRKRLSAQLDFDDLLDLAVRLLRSHSQVRDALAERYRFVLVDEFQDTDPRQAEIVWRLTSTPADAPWTEWRARPGARFLVGDPKQAIYRFRHADVDTYLELRGQVEADPGCARLAITTNFRSAPGVIDLVNASFAGVLDEAPQPGYQALHPHREGDDDPAVARLVVPAIDGEASADKVGASDVRRFEARAVASLCARLIAGKADPLQRKVDAGEIALLAPTSTELWRYERELELLGISVASQAGKGFYDRQEVKDLIALSCALADTSDRAALGALLRSPLVGATEEQLLDVAEHLHQRHGDGRLSFRVDPEEVPVEEVRDALARLRPLWRRRRGASPYQTLAAALERLEVRATLVDRHGGHADRALANVDRFLDLSRAYRVRGLQAFARDMRASWSDGEARETEGRPDAARDAVTLVTVHSAKGLEWPVVIPINTFGKLKGSELPFVERADERLWAAFDHARPLGVDEAMDREDQAQRAERVRLWYVTATRACDLFVVPEPAFSVKQTDSFRALVTLAVDDAPAIGPFEAEPRSLPRPGDGAQDPETFRAEAERIATARREYAWRSPSRHDGDAHPPSERVAVWSEAEGGPVPGEAAREVVGAGPVRGAILHALLEELITGEVEENALQPRAEALTQVLTGASDDARARPDPTEMAATVQRAWNLPAVAALRDRLLAEVDVYGVDPSADTRITHVAGIADAIAVDEDGRGRCVIDWKSDRDPGEETIAAHREQLADYLRLTETPEGLLVFLTPGRVETVRLEDAAAAGEATT